MTRFTTSGEPPTASNGHVDLSVQMVRASVAPLSRAIESGLPSLHAIREDCACGMSIVSPTQLWPDIADAVQRHHVEPLHESWREANGL